MGLEVNEVLGKALVIGRALIRSGEWIDWDAQKAEIEIAKLAKKHGATEKEDSEAIVNFVMGYISSAR